ncbi:MAG: ABC transporter substrate-binding protein [Chloroflexi bacterium]|nr:ABC transporter substrate-binding protein [Chloroflexota bacterium]
MKMRSLWILGIALLVLGLGVVPVAAQENPDCPQTGGTFVLGVDTYLGNIDPPKSPHDWVFYGLTNLYSMMFRLNFGDPSGDIVESWELSEDGTVYTFHLRDNIYWHDGNEIFAEGEARRVDAHDVVYTFERQVALTEEGFNWPPDLLQGIESVEALDDDTVVLTLNAPNPVMFNRGRGWSATAIVAREAVEYWGEDYGLTGMLGSGPFEFVSYVSEEELVLRRNEDYYIQPCFDEFITRVIKDTDSGMIALEAGDVDWWGAVVPGDYVERFIDSEEITLINFGCPVETRMMMTVGTPPFDDIRFREALVRARDGEAVNAALRGATHVKGAGTAGPGVPGYTEGLYDEFYAHDMDRAVALLDEIGIVDSDGDGLREWNGEDITDASGNVIQASGENLVIPIHHIAGYPFPEYAAAMADAGSKVGITVESVQADGATITQYTRDGKWGMYLNSGWCSDGGTNGLWGRAGWAEPLGYGDELLYDLLDQAAVEIDRAHREDLLQQATRRTAELYYGNSWGWFNIYTAKRNTVKNFNGGWWTVDLATPDNLVWLDEGE